MMAPRPELLSRRIDEEEALVKRDEAAVRGKKDDAVIAPSHKLLFRKALCAVMAIALIALMRLVGDFSTPVNNLNGLSWSNQVNGVVKEGEELRLWNSMIKSASSAPLKNYNWSEELARRTIVNATTDLVIDKINSSLRGSNTSSWSSHGIILMFTSDIHGHVMRTCRGPSCYPGAANIASVIRTVRQSDQYPSLLIDNGDALFGAPGVDESVVADVMNLLGYDAMALGNHDFDIGAKRLENFAERLKFPILASNVDGPTFVRKHLRINLGDGAVLCLVGVSTAEANPLAGDNVTIRPEGSVVKYITQLKGDGTCQHAVVVSHGGIVVDQDIARHSNVIDAVIGGHSHVATGVPANAMPESAEFGEVWDRPFPFRVNATDALIAHVGSYGRYMGLLKLEWVGSNMTRVEGNLVPLDARHGVEPDRVVDRWLVDRMSSDNSSSSSNARTMTLNLGKGVAKNDVCGFVCRKKECLLGNFVADAMRSCALNGPCLHSVPETSKGLPVVAFLESGTLRDCVSTDGDEDFSSILPWPNDLVLLTATGSTLREMLEHGVKSREANGGAFLQTSGLSYKYRRNEVTNVTIPLDLKHDETHGVQRGQNQVTMTRNPKRCLAENLPSSESLHNDTLYLVVVTDWLAAGGDGYGTLVTSSQSSTRTNVTLREMVLEYSSISPHVKREGRACLAQSATPSSTVNAMSGFVGGYIAFFSSFPLYTLFVRKSTNGKEQASRKGLFDGVWLGSLATAICQFIYFLIYHSESLLQYSPFVRASTGSISTVLATNPLWVVVTRMQTADGKLSGYSAATMVLQEQGWGGFFAGVLMNLAMCVFPIVRQVTMEALLEKVGDIPDSPTRVAIAAGFGACVATIVTLPIQRWRVRLQQGMKGKNAITAGADCCDGLWFKILHSCVSSFVLFVVKVHLDDAVVLALMSD